MTDGVMSILAPCWACGRLFLSDPERVVSVSVCRECKRPPDLHANDCGQRQYGKRAPSDRQPICLDCVQQINERKRASGQTPIHVIPGAYFEDL